jgi:hypothetical protein
MNYSFLVALVGVAVLFGIPLLVGASVEAKRRRAAEQASLADQQAENSVAVSTRRAYEVHSGTYAVQVGASAVIQDAMATIAQRALPRNQVSVADPPPVMPSAAMADALAWSQRERPKA